MPLWFALGHNFHYKNCFSALGLRSKEWASSPCRWEKSQQNISSSLGLWEAGLEGHLRTTAFRAAFSWPVWGGAHGLFFQVSWCSNWESNTMGYASEVSWKLHKVEEHSVYLCESQYTVELKDLKSLLPVYMLLHLALSKIRKAAILCQDFSMEIVSNKESHRRNLHLVAVCQTRWQCCVVFVCFLTGIDIRKQTQ